MANALDASTFQAQQHMLDCGAYRLCCFTWPDPLVDIKADVLLVHGLGEHAGRYNHVASALQNQGYKVHAYDHYGHGKSDGKRGDLLEKNQLIADAKRVANALRKDRPLVLLGHSMGGLVVTRLLALQPEMAQAAVLSSPALAVYTGWLDKLLLAAIPHLLPHLRVDNKLKINWLARDPKVVMAYQQDPLVHRKISALLGAWIVEQGSEAIAQASDWQTPSLLLYAGQDKLVDPTGSRLFTQQVSAHVLQTQCYDDMYHEIFNDPEKERVLQVLIDWLNHQFDGNKGYSN